MTGSFSHSKLAIIVMDILAAIGDYDDLAFLRTSPDWFLSCRVVLIVHIKSKVAVCDSGIVEYFDWRNWRMWNGMEAPIVCFSYII